jgi:hypothetical protein
VKRQDNPGGRFSEAFRSIHEMYHAILLYFDAFGAQPFICRYSISSTNNGLHHWNSHLFCPHIRLDDDACMRHVNECSVFFPCWWLAEEAKRYSYGIVHYRCMHVRDAYKHEPRARKMSPVDILKRTRHAQQIIALGCIHFSCKPKIFPLPPITSNLWMHVWSIKYR